MKCRAQEVGGGRRKKEERRTKGSDRKSGRYKVEQDRIQKEQNVTEKKTKEGEGNRRGAKTCGERKSKRK